jgi:short-subunit dehydrogenase
VHALVTGASAGLGEAIARRLARDGYSLTLVARRKERLQAVAREVKVPVCVLTADLADSREADRVVVEAAAANGAIDVLVNNAGVQYVEPVENVSGPRISALLAINLDTPLRLMQLVLPHMLAQGRGTVVNISSIGGLIPTPGMSHYCGAKAGLAAASECARAELALRGVHVLTVYPGPVASDMEAAARAALGDGVLTRLMPTGTPDGLAEAVAQGISRRKARTIYPQVYALAWAFPNVSRWMVERFSPRPAGAMDRD